MARRRLNPGEDSIETVSATKQPNGGYLVQWSICLYDGRVLVRQKSRGKTAGEARANARAKAAELLLNSGNAGKYKPTSAISEYIDDVSQTAVIKADLRPNTRARYDLCLAQLGTALDGHTIATALRFRVLEDALQAIASKHGTESARQARNVLSKYVIGQLIRDDLASGNPLTGMSIDLGHHKAKAKPAGGRALPANAYDRVLVHLLDLDPTEGISAPKRGKYTLADRIGVRRSAIDLTLLQMSTGLRISEARTLAWSDVSTDVDGTLRVTVTEERSKTHRARTVPVLDDRVSAHLSRRRKKTGGSLVVGAPAKPSTVWEASNAQKAVKRLYAELAEDCDAPLLTEAGSHVWRATLNTMYLGKIPDAVRAAYFGHDEEINRSAYTDTTDTSALLDAARARRERG